MTDTPMIGILVRQHVEIAQAVNARDAQAAEAAMREHLREILRPLPDLVRRRADLFED